MPTISDFTGQMRRETDRMRLTAHLRDVARCAVDVVAPHSALRWNNGLHYAEAIDARLQVPGQQFIFPDGVYDWLDLTATRSSINQQANRLRIPMSFLDRLRKDHRDLWADNLNTLAEREDRTATLRMLRCDDGYLLRAIVSDRYASVDNLDVLSAVAAGLMSADVGLEACEVDADWTIDRFRLRIAVPQIAVAVPDLLSDYRPMFSMLPGRGVHARPEEGETSPLLWAGLEVTNGETGGKALTIAPRAVVQVCRNGLTRTKDMVRQVHVGERLDEGIRWSSDTRRLSVELMTSKVADAARQFCSVDYLNSLVVEMRAAKGLEVQSPTAAIQVLGRSTILTDAESQATLDLFAMSGDRTVFGLAQAVTAMAQSAESGDRQSEVEEAAWSVLLNPHQYATASA
jgi:hypothetical protein